MTQPLEITLEQNSRRLKIRFDNGDFFTLAYEYLRVFSPSAEVMGHSPSERQWPQGKANVGVLSVHPVGNYAIILAFDDGHQTGIYSWRYLHELGTKFDENWRLYQEKLASDAR
jgi:DUF971 family protein